MFPRSLTTPWTMNCDARGALGFQHIRWPSVPRRPCSAIAMSAERMAKIARINRETHVAHEVGGLFSIRQCSLNLLSVREPRVLPEVRLDFLARRSQHINIPLESCA